jgi:TonB-linked SusC/RagA family outer membrane protein
MEQTVMGKIPPARWGTLVKKWLLIMRITAILLLATALHVSAIGYSQSVNISSRKISIEQVFQSLEKQTGYSFFWDNELLPKNKTIPIHVSNGTLEDALKQCLSGMALSYRLRDNVVYILPSKNQAPAPVAEVVVQLVVKGKVVNDKGVPLNGVSIVVKGTKKGAVSNAQGAFTINNVNNDDVLVFSLVGHTTLEIPVNGQADISVTLQEEVSNLEGVVVMGYGQKQSKISVTGAVSSIQTKELKQSPVANLSNALAGRMPGLITTQRSGRPGSDASNLYIRGISTSGNASPLVVIDGLPRGDANFGDIDPNEVESVSILKDASSTALYGIQGANGIVLITTKRGKESAPNIQANMQYALQQPVRRTRFLDSYTSGLLQNEAASNDGLDPVYSDMELALYKNQLKPALYPDLDWYNLIMRDLTPQKQANINISGGSKYVRYFVSGSYLRQEPSYNFADKNAYGVKYKFDRYNFRSNVDITLNKNLDLQVDLASRLENRTGPRQDRNDNDYFFILLSQIGNGITPVYNPDKTLAIGQLPNGYANPYGILTQSGYYDDFWHSTNGNIAVTHKLDFITKGLKVRGLFSFENYGNISFSNYQDFDSFRYTEDKTNGDPIYTRYSTGSSISKDGGNSGERYYYYDMKLLYDRTFGDHTVNGIFLFNRFYRSQTGNLPRVYEGFVLHMGYDFRKKYFLEFNAGYNGSENFPPDKRYGFFPAVSGGWVISEEDFMGEGNTLSLLKLRASHGLVGNDQIGGNRWLFMSDYKPQGGNVFGSTPNWADGYVENRVGNTAITWERAAKTNVGIETGFFNNKYKLTVDLFRELRSNILTPAFTIPDYVGISAAINRNKGKVLNRGVEVELTANSNIGAVNIYSRLTYTYIKNKVLDMDEPKLAYPYQSTVGYPIGYALGYEAIGLFRSAEEIAASPRQEFSSVLIPGDIKYRDVNGDKVINDADRVMIPVLNIPSSIMGLTLGANYKGIDISVLLQGATGGRQIYSGQLTNGYRLGYRPHHLGRWTPENADNATYPVLHLQESNASNNALQSTYWVRNTDYLKIKNLEIGYQLPTQWVRIAGLKSARIYFTGMNLISWDHVKDLGIDPESNSSGRYGWQPYPIQRVYNTGITINL